MQPEKIHIPLLTMPPLPETLSDLLLRIFRSLISSPEEKFLSSGFPNAFKLPQNFLHLISPYLPHELFDKFLLSQIVLDPIPPLIETSYFPATVPTLEKIKNKDLRRSNRPHKKGRASNAEIENPLLSRQIPVNFKILSCQVIPIF